MSLAKIVIKANGTERVVEVNGQDISGLINHATLDLTPGDVPHLGVSFAGSPVDFEGPGIVHVSGLQNVDPREYIMGFLDSVDPAVIEARALELGGLDQEPAVSFIDALKELAR